jgi:leucyl aminopeptidase
MLIMHRNKKLFFILNLFFVFISTAHAQVQNPHIIVAPQCLLEKINTHYETLASSENISLIKADEEMIDQLIAAKHPQSKPCGGFMDVTQAWDDYHAKNVSANAAGFLSNYVMTPKKIAVESKATYSIRYPAQVNQLLSQLNPQRMWTDLQQLSSFTDRYANSDTGLQAAQWIKSQMEAMAKGRCDVKVYLVPTGNYKQPSVVVKIGSASRPGIVLGAHMDTLLARSGTMMPGADDDGTGAVTLFEVARTVLSSGMRFKKPVYFVWYAAEEIGLVGSQYVVKDFKNKNIPVSEVMQLDMTGYANKNDLTMWLIDDNVNKDLTTYLETLISTYVKQPVKHTACGYACSDHATWTQNGFASCFPFEASIRSYNPYIHSPNDTMEKLSLDHISNFSKLGIAFMVELAEPG